MTNPPILLYLAGPIDDVEVQTAQGWRVALELPLNVVTFSPAHAYSGVSSLTAEVVDKMNRYAIVVADGVLAKLDGEGKGFGTVREVEFARSQGKPVCVVGKVDSLLAYDVEVRPTVEDGMTALLEMIRDGRSQPRVIGVAMGPIFRQGQDEAGD